MHDYNCPVESEIMGAKRRRRRCVEIFLSTS